MNEILAGLWEQAEKDGAFSSVFLRAKNGDSIPFMIAPVMNFEGQPTLYKKVESIFRKDGKENKSEQYLVRIITVEAQKGGKISFDNSETKCLQASKTMFNSLVKMVNSGYELGGQTGHVVVLVHDGKRSLIPTPKQVEIPEDVLEASKTTCLWDEIMAEHEKLQSLNTEKAEDDKEGESMPWETK